MEKIQGASCSVHELLVNKKYTIDFYQREYNWGKKEINDLINDLTTQFLKCYNTTDERTDIRSKYDHYFLGSIIISDTDHADFIIDGQQRLTSLTLLLICIYRRLEDERDRRQVSNLITSSQFGEDSFTLDVEDRLECMTYLYESESFNDDNAEASLYESESFNDDNAEASVRNIMARFKDIQELLFDNITDKQLPYFSDWLIWNVHFIKINANSDYDAYMIFETMNYRGLSLTSIDMLKGYLLSKIEDPSDKLTASNIWVDQVQELRKIEKEGDAIKTWLRSQYADTFRQNTSDELPDDHDLIVNEPHRWIKNHEDNLGLIKSSDFLSFIADDFLFYTEEYMELHKASEGFIPGFEAVRYNAEHNFSLQYPLILSALCKDDSSDTIHLKKFLISTYIDIIISRRIWNRKVANYSNMKHMIFRLMKDIRGRTVGEIIATFKAYIQSEENFSDNPRFSLHGGNRPQIHRLLARMTCYIEENSDNDSNYLSYINQGRKDGYEIEHIWADKYERYAHEFEDEEDFNEYRNRIGGLLLLEKSVNSSLRDKPYEEKRDTYLTCNLLAASLHETIYDSKPRFRQFISKSGLDFKPYENFGKNEVEARQQLYLRIAEEVWSSEKLFEEVEHR